MIQYIQIQGKPWARDASRGGPGKAAERRKAHEKAEGEMRAFFTCQEPAPKLPPPSLPNEYRIEALRA